MENKENALCRLAAIEKEAAELRKIIEAADKPKSLEERVVDVESAIKELPCDDEEVRTYRKLQGASITGHTLAYQELVIACKAMNGGKYPTGADERYCPWFDISKKPTSGFFSDSCYWSSGSSYSLSLPAHLQLFKKAHALHLGKVFEKTYHTYILRK